MSDFLSAHVVVFDWAESGASCCTTQQLVYCKYDAIVEWMTQRLIDAATLDYSKKILDTILIGQDITAQLFGSIAKAVNAQLNETFHSIISLNAAGPQFKVNGNGRCIDLNPTLSDESIAFYTENEDYGNHYFDLADTNILVDFCEIDPPTESLELHEFAAEIIFPALVQNATLVAVSTADASIVDVTIASTMPAGEFTLRTCDNPTLQ